MAKEPSVCVHELEQTVRNVVADIIVGDKLDALERKVEGLEKLITGKKKEVCQGIRKEFDLIQTQIKRSKRNITGFVDKLVEEEEEEEGIKVGENNEENDHGRGAQNNLSILVDRYRNMPRMSLRGKRKMIKVMPEIKKDQGLRKTLRRDKQNVTSDHGKLEEDATSDPRGEAQNTQNGNGIHLPDMTRDKGHHMVINEKNQNVANSDGKLVEAATNGSRSHAQNQNVRQLPRRHASKPKRYLEGSQVGK